MNAGLAHKPREDFDLTDCERIAQGIIATAENLRDGVVSAKAARISAAQFLAMLDALPAPATALARRCSLLTFLTAEWADELESRVDQLVALECQKLAMTAINLIQTTMAREAGMMP